MKTQAWLLVVTLALASAPLTTAEDPEDPPEGEGGEGPPRPPKVVIPKPPVCSWKTVGDLVGYGPGKLDSDALGGTSVHWVNDDDYNARGAFQTQGTQSYGGKTYDVFLIRAGFSESADWCPEMGSVGG
jgi:hypothetical protein